MVKCASCNTVGHCRSSSRKCLNYHVHIARIKRRRQMREERRIELEERRARNLQTILEDLRSSDTSAQSTTARNAPSLEGSSSTSFNTLGSPIYISDDDNNDNSINGNNGNNDGNDDGNNDNSNNENDNNSDSDESMNNNNDDDDDDDDDDSSDDVEANTASRGRGGNGNENENNIFNNIIDNIDHDELAFLDDVDDSSRDTVILNHSSTRGAENNIIPDSPESPEPEPEPEQQQLMEDNAGEGAEDEREREEEEEEEIIQATPRRNKGSSARFARFDFGIFKNIPFTFDMRDVTVNWDFGQKNVRPEKINLPIKAVKPTVRQACATLPLPVS